MPQTNPLSANETAYLHEMVGLSGYTAADVADLASLLSDEQLALVRDDIDLWSRLREKDTRIDSQGVSVDPNRARRTLRARARQRLGIFAPSSGLFRMGVGC